MPEALLAGVRVIDVAGEPAAMTGRILADLGAEVVKVEPPGGDPLRSVPPLGPDGTSLRFAAWSAGKTCLESSGPDDPRLGELLEGADVVLGTPGWPGALDVDPARAPGAVWVLVTPFGSDGPRARWRASDLGVMASTGNMYCTGDPDRAPVRCTEPTAWAHVGPEAVVATLSALASGRPQVVDVSAQEAVMIASMGHVGRFPRTKMRGKRSGASVGITREIWPCQDGFVSFGLRGGKARVANMQTITRLVDRGRPGDAGAHGAGLDDLRPQPGRALRARRHRSPHRPVLPAPHHGRALRDRGGDQPHARPGQLPAPAHREPPARGPRLLLRARAGHPLPPLVPPRHEPRRRRGQARARRAGPVRR